MLVKRAAYGRAYDLTLVDRHITVILNGEKVIDNQPVTGPTAGAVFTNPTQPGPIYLARRSYKCAVSVHIFGPRDEGLESIVFSKV